MIQMYILEVRPYSTKSFKILHAEIDYLLLYHDYFNAANI